MRSNRIAVECHVRGGLEADGHIHCQWAKRTGGAGSEEVGGVVTDTGTQLDSPGRSGPGEYAGFG